MLKLQVNMDQIWPILMKIQIKGIKRALKRVESKFFAIFTVEVTKTSIATNYDHSKNYVHLIRNLQD